MDKYYQVKAEELDEIIQENETLKANASVLQEYITKNEQMKENASALAKKCHTYKSALEEIKNIVENLSHCKIPHEHCFQDDCSDCILNEIKKVLNDSEG